MAPPELDVAAFLGVCRIKGAERDRLLALCQEQHTPGWLQQHGSRLPKQLVTFIDHENRAVSCHHVQPMIVPGLLQTGEYARAVISGVVNVPPEEVDDRVAARLARQNLFSRDRPARFTFYLHESALRTPVGGRAVMREQLHHLLRMSTRPYLTIRVVPLALGAHAATAGPFIFLEFAQFKPVVYLESETSCVFPEPWSYAARNWALLRHILSDSAQTTTSVLAGEGGDELLLGQVFAVADRFARGNTEDAGPEVQTFPNPESTHKVIQDLLHGEYDRMGNRVMRALGDVPPWLTGSYLAETGIVDSLAAGYPQFGTPGRMAADYSCAVLREMGAAGRVQCGGWWEDMGRKLDIKITYPFLDPDLAALVWSLPPELLRDDGMEKVVLREALSDPSAHFRRSAARQGGCVDAHACRTCRSDRDGTDSGARRAIS